MSPTFTLLHPTYAKIVGLQHSLNWVSVLSERMVNELKILSTTNLDDQLRTLGCDWFKTEFWMCCIKLRPQST